MKILILIFSLAACIFVFIYHINQDFVSHNAYFFHSSQLKTHNQPKEIWTNPRALPRSL
ncbi:hypothetical protein EDF73_102577 [Raoultella sp. BIGb0138]|nr:hypothetical protein EDF73_102577 [Raoultella sp. BIGb0138]